MLSLVGSLFLLEALAWICCIFLPEVPLYKNNPDWFYFSSDTGWERRKNFTGGVYNISCSFDSHGLFSVDTEDIIQTNKCKILLVGDSCTFGIGIDVSKTYGEVLEALVPNVSTINFAVPGYSSYQGLKLLEKSIRHIEPDIVLMSFNHNDRRYVSKYRTDNAIYFFKVYTENTLLPFLSKHTHLFKVLNTILTKKYFDEQTMIVDVCDLKPRVSLQAYKNNILNMIAITQANGAMPIFLGLGDNPKTCQFIRDAVAAYTQGDKAQAFAQLLSASYKTNSWTALARRYLCSFPEQTKRKQINTSVSYINWLHGGDVIVCDTQYQQAAKEVCRMSNALYVDGALALNKHPQVYYDACHFNKEGHQLIAELLAPIIQPLTDK